MVSQVFADFNLHWAAKTRSVPVQTAVASFGQQNRGMIVTLDDEGSLSVGYLGEIIAASNCVNCLMLCHRHPPPCFCRGRGKSFPHA